MLPAAGAVDGPQEHVADMRRNFEVQARYRSCNSQNRARALGGVGGEIGLRGRTGREMGDGRWEMGDGRWETDDGQPGRGTHTLACFMSFPW